jgi:putative colanic acid biosysnthesis UDP-glucose lipid carrier transferase
VAGWLLTVVLRLGARAVLRALRRRGYSQRRVVIAVASELGLNVAKRLRDRPDAGFEVVGFFDDRDPERVRNSGGPPLLGNIDEMAKYVAEHQVDAVWIALPFRAEDRVRDILKAMRHSTADVCLVPDVFQFFMLNQALGQVAGVPLLALNSTPLQGANRLVKAIEDRVLAALILLLVSPVMLAVAIAIRLDSPGAILFRQRRHGRHDEPIEMLKFRTMRPHVQAPGTYTLATRGDKRVTSIGAYLRRTSLDELPQFINVLRGDMSIVGPRPYPIEINDEYKEVVDRYMLRHKVKPGITGWAQVNGLRGALDTPDKMERRVMHDLYYIEHWSLWFDLKIIFLTIFRGFVHENAY